jgi:hypothetical protein
LRVKAFGLQLVDALHDPTLVIPVCDSPSCIGRIRADRQDIIWVRQDA